MMKLNRFALVAGVLALGAAACGDDVQVVEPTPPQPPPPPPVEATMAPASASVAVGNSVVFAVNASGGVAGEAASWTCSSSNTGIASVTSTSAGCSATGVAAGDVTITASVTKSGETVNVGAQLTVTSDEVVEPPQQGDPAFVVVASITGEDNTNVSGLKGRVTVTLNVERGDQELEGLALLVDGEMVASQSFGSGMDMGMTPPDEAAEQAVHAFTMSFDSDGYEEHGDHTDVDYMNGEHTISAELEIGVTMADGMHGHETISSNVVTVEFDNEDGYIVTADLGHNTALDDDGRVWYGGPDNGHVVVSALAVSYSGDEVAGGVVVRLEGCEAEEDDEFDCKGQQSDREISILADGVKRAILNADDLPEANIDMAGPDAPHFNADPNGREGGWINQAVLVATSAGEYHSSRNKDGWLVYNEDDEGVGGYSAQLRFSTTTPTIVDGARGAAPNALPTEHTKANAACVIATAVDLLGNESKLPSAGKGCAMAEAYGMAVDALDEAVKSEDEDAIDEARGDIPAGIRAGLDVTAPTIEFSTASPKADASSLKNFQVQVADAGGSTGKSGLHSDPVLARIEVRDADNDIICGDDDDVGGPTGKEKITGECVLAAEGIDFNDPLATTKGLSSTTKTHGYYTFTAISQDKAGNRSEEVMRTAVNDDEDPELGLIVGGYDKGSWSLTATLTDDLSIKQYWAEAVDDIAGITGAIILPREGPVMVDEYNSPDLTQNLLETVKMQVFRALQAATTGTSPTSDTYAAEILAEIKVVGVDQGGGDDAANNTSLGSTASLAKFGLGTARTSTFTATEPTTAAELTTQNDAVDQWNDNKAGDDSAIRYARDEVFQTFTVEDDESDDDVLELRATIAGTAGYVKAVVGAVDDADTDDTDEGKAAVAGVEGLVDNPVSRVDFYAAVDLKSDDVGGTDTNRVPPVPDGPGDSDDAADALVFLGSSNAAGAEDFVDDQDNTDPADDVDMRKYVWGLDMSGAAFVEIAGDEGSYTIVAVAVNSAGVAIAATTTEDVEK